MHGAMPWRCFKRISFLISHELGCIFVHIPRTGGSSVEHWLCGKDWWNIEPEIKHLTARQSRDLYAHYWDRYFKFSIVRDPLTRVSSMLQHAKHFGIDISPNGAIAFQGYLDHFGAPVTVEFDYRFHDAGQVRHAAHAPNQIYGNMLDCDLDFVGRFESLVADMDFVRTRLGVASAMAVHHERSSSVWPESVLIASREAVQAMYANDYATFGYSKTE